jgi:hypothetical protein
MYPVAGRALRMYPHCNVPPCHGRVHLDKGTATAPQNELQVQDPEEYQRIMGLKESRWEKGLGLFSTIEELM